ncbi:protein translocase subunit secY/sec61 alpha [Rubritalea squalenifaciens DSM 18772]|uniref:Protein translocase subunit SecY n=1 Tax=Rubritalea squalenifaciens DSM 18772 TaxID=1123071 RepID=A0A1M6RTU4_9BACT|nr:preprotein translocase subunit SecY [Rubritalea squalenifaciens]SHK35717.1 protein translocase subunit secY/sec61 alpha [Rubritalea squalenifaciens DSM 18772]
MISAFANTWKVTELRERIIFMLVMIVVVRLGVHITLPGIDGAVVEAYTEGVIEKGGQDGGILDTMATIFSGGGLQQLGIFALGIMPYISASILMQLMTAVMPKLSKLSREDGGRQKINQYTRFITILIALVQGAFLANQISNNPGSLPFFTGIEAYGELVPNAGFMFIAMFTLCIVTGTLFLMWIGDQMTDRGIGNGTSMIITVNIISSLPAALSLMWKTLITGEKGGPAGAAFVVFLFAFLIFIVAATIAITQAQRRIAIQYAKRVVGRKQYGGQTQYLPLKLNYANVMPIIFATAILGIPVMLANQVFSGQRWAATMSNVLAMNSPWYYVIAGAMIFFFSYFWVATMFQPSEIAENLKRSGGYIPGIRPGQPTAKFLDFTMTRLTFAGAIFLTIIFILPWIVSQMPLLFNGPELNQMVTGFFGGTSLLIMVGVILDVMRQVETHLLQRNYDGFLRKGKIKGRTERRQNVAASKGSNSMLYLMVVIAILLILGVVALTVR